MSNVVIFEQKELVNAFVEYYSNDNDCESIWHESKFGRLLKFLESKKLYGQTGECTHKTQESQQ